MAFSIVFAISGSVSGSAGSGSGITRSIIPSSFNSAAVIFMTRAASSARLLSFHRIDAKPSGERTEYTAFSIIQTSFATAMASAPPLPPSPITMESTGTIRSDISKRFLAMASPCPRSSASSPQKAPGVSTKHTTGRPNVSACFMRRSAFRYPSGDGIPKLRLMLSFVFLPFSCPITVTGIPWKEAIPPTMAPSSLQ